MVTVMNRYIYIMIALSLALFTGCSDSSSIKSIAKERLELSQQQMTLLLQDAEREGNIPRTVTAEGEMHWIKPGFDWTEGFFPGSCWYLYQYSNNKLWLDGATSMQNRFINHKDVTFSHDLGFIFNCSYGNGYSITKDDSYKQVLIDAATSLSTRFNKNVGCIQSWNVDRGWQATRGWKYPVIIDNMMNLEMLFTVAELTGDSKFSDIAKSHADVTMKNHFRDDYSSYHVIDYDPNDGSVRNRNTAQGYAHESSWARGQAWGLYGYTVCYRFTKDPKYLEMAEKIADFILNDSRVPADAIPYWDYDAPNIPNEPRDVSAAAITASALIELDGYSDADYMKGAEKILVSLSSPEYFAEIGTNNHFILKHSVGSIPHNNEIDVPLNYADYYYIEALTRILDR